MIIVFVTTLNSNASTNRGRVFPLANHLQKAHQLHVITLDGPMPKQYPGLHIHSAGKEPFTRSDHGKTRLRGPALVLSLAQNIWHTARILIKLKADVVVIVKPLPQNTIAVALFRLFHQPKKIILDIDDFELGANVTTSFLDRAVLHFSQRLALRYATRAVVATPYLSDYITQLSGHRLPISFIPTGITPPDSIKNHGDIQIAYLGSLSESSGHMISLIPAIIAEVNKQGQEPRVLIAGSGDNASALKEALNSPAITSPIIWHGPFSETDVGSLLSNSTIIIDPIGASPVVRAKSSYRAMLAASLGLPVVTSNIGIRSLIIPSTLKDRLIAKPADSQDYAHKIINLIKEPLTSDQSQSLIQNTKKFHWQKLAEQYQKLIQE